MNKIFKRYINTFYVLKNHRKVKHNKSDIGAVVNSKLFDKEWYVQRYADLKNSNIKGENHYKKHGFYEGRDCHSLFSMNWYCKQFNEKIQLHPVLSYLSRKNDLIDPHPLFDSGWYINKYSSCLNFNGTPLEHYLENRKNGNYVPSRLFENNFSIKDLPSAQKYKTSTSPILSKVPPTRYLIPYRKENQKIHKQYNTLDEFFRKSLLISNLIKDNIAENELRIIGMMDFNKRWLAQYYSELSQDELVSVIMPTSNRPHMIADAVNSVLAQSYKNWELIVVDDGSCDETKALLDSYNDKRIRYFRNSCKIGNAATRNRGLKESVGTVISYLDDDDVWDPDFILISLHHMRKNKKRMLYSAQMVWRGFDEVTRLGYSFMRIQFNTYNRSKLENMNYISMITVIHDRSLLADAGCFDETLSRLVDWDLFLRFTEFETPISLPCILSHYLRDRDPSSVTSVNSIEDNLKLINTKLRERSCQSLLIEDEDKAHELYGLSKHTLNIRSMEKWMSSSFGQEIVQIIIPNYEAIPDLNLCLESIIKNTDTPFEITIVDNGSCQESRVALTDIVNRYDNVSWIPYDEEAGFTYAVNRGIKEIKDKKGDVLILNNDTVVTPGWLTELQYVLHQYPEAGMAVPRQVLFTGNPINKIHSPDTLPIFEVDINLSAHHDNVLNPVFDEDGLVELTYAALFCSLIRRESLDKLGALDSANGPHFRSDWILCQALRSILKQRIIYSPYSKVYHLQGVSTKLSTKIHLR